MNVKLQSPNKILYLDTSKEEATLAVFEMSGRTCLTVGKESWQAGRELSKTLTQKYSDILKKVGVAAEDLSGICVFVGPGSFTGLRIGISFANGLAFALDIPAYETKIQGQVDLSDPKKIALPFYGAEPKITQPKEKR